MLIYNVSAMFQRRLCLVWGPQSKPAEIMATSNMMHCVYRLFAHFLKG